MVFLHYFIASCKKRANKCSILHAEKRVEKKSRENAKWYYWLFILDKFISPLLEDGCNKSNSPKSKNS
jgi:hypothetical protein